ncbi:tubulin beta-1 chain [Striga asiatica]|uniref:Tubulin beta-1 chain n=1 Tax=Striga asiatica TaxID=4170 RepID=A0A5A7R4N6_STRAF|nr:tubulin beta-1 chain [Striga asiatica]
MNSVEALLAWAQPGDQALPSKALLDFSDSFSRPNASIVVRDTFSWNETPRQEMANRFSFQAQASFPIGIERRKSLLVIIIDLPWLEQKVTIKALHAKADLTQLLLNIVVPNE